MNILMLSDVYFPRINGVSTSILTFRRELARLGHRVVLIAPDYGQKADPEEGIIRIPSRYLALDPEDRAMKPRAIRRLTERLRDQRFDVLHIQTPFIAHHVGVQLSARLGIPRVETYHTFFEEYLFHYVPFLPERLLRLAAKRFSRYQCNNVDGLIVPSQAMLQVLQAYGVTARAQIIPTGLRLEQLSGGDGARFRARHGIPPTRPTLVHIGRLAFEKNIPFLLQVLRRLSEEMPDVLLVIAGEGPARKHLQAQVQELGLQSHVLFVGYLREREQLLGCYRAGDAFVFASRTETQGLVLLEAMAAGVPVVSTAVMGTRDILDAGKGALVAAEDVEDFSRQVSTVLRDPALRARLSKEGQDYVQQWSAEQMALRLVGFYADIAADPR